MIPKLIHQTAKTADLDEPSRRYQAVVRRLHPGWEYRFWTDADNDAFVRAEYPDFHATFVGLPKGIMRADVIRYLLMDKLGGLYLDLDYEMLRPLDDLLHHGCVLPYESGDPVPGPADLLGNAVFASTPGHPFFRRVIEVMKSRPPVPPDAPVLSTTGPAFLTGVYRSMTPAEQATVYTPPRRLFHPQTPRNGREYRAVVADKAAYGIHHCHGTWRDYTLGEKLHLWASRLYHKLR